MDNKNALIINSIGDLQIALLEDDNSAITNYIERLDRESSNEAFKVCGQQFDFPVVEIEGVFRTTGSHLSKVFGYKKTNALTELLERRGIEGVSVGGFTYNTQIKIIEALGLDRQDRKSILLDWPAFLIGGMNSQNEEARSVQAYLLRMEKIARVGIVATREGLLSSKIPDAAIGAVMCNLAKEAWRGNNIASHILEQHYQVPVAQLLEYAEPEITEITETLACFLKAVCVEKVNAPGLLITDIPNGWRVAGRTVAYFHAFIEVAVRHKLRHFFRSPINLGSIMGRQTFQLELLGWRRRVIKVRGYYHYIYTYEIPGKDDETALTT